jgi:transcriptional regulator with XRE-family HTH domain
MEDAMADKTTDTEAKALAERLKDTREYLGLSQQFVSEQTGIPRSAISDIERGVRRVESLELKKLSRIYRYPVEYFLGGDDAETDSSVADAGTVQALARAAGDLTKDDQEEVLRFANFLKHYGRSRESS